ncbi:hypothetical protein C462_07875 [Halorubrum distributum JCM 13916]|uniref:Uncharacterized protein n=1 Tax=Halorubrum distributum JCM 13916 TaxID=1230455 RepID=M0PM94_9EURY|nr:hypothetical protein C462_07875 [Halorubrum arcis JCM 13916]
MRALLKTHFDGSPRLWPIMREKLSVVGLHAEWADENTY